jgi:hypothetical protein
MANLPTRMTAAGEVPEAPTESAHLRCNPLGEGEFVHYRHHSGKGDESSIESHLAQSAQTRHSPGDYNPIALRSFDDRASSPTNSRLGPIEPHRQPTLPPGSRRMQLDQVGVRTQRRRSCSVPGGYRRYEIGGSWVVLLRLRNGQGSQAASARSQHLVGRALRQSGPKLLDSNSSVSWPPREQLLGAPELLAHLVP